MKILIWLACIAVYSLVVTLLRTQGILLGGIPTVLLALVIVFLPAPLLCKRWGKRQTDKGARQAEQYREKCKDKPLCGTPFIQAREKLDQELADGTIAQAEYDEKISALGHPEEDAVPMERWYTCPKCGQLVREGEACDCEEVAAELAAKEQEPHPRKSRAVIPLAVVCIALAACSCVLAVQLQSSKEANRLLESENGIITATLHDLSDENARLEQEISTLQRDTESSYTEWKSLYDAGYITLTYDEWQVFTGGNPGGKASDFLRGLVEQANGR